MNFESCVDQSEVVRSDVARILDRLDPSVPLLGNRSLKDDPWMVSLGGPTDSVRSSADRCVPLQRRNIAAMSCSKETARPRLGECQGYVDMTSGTADD